MPVDSARFQLRQVVALLVIACAALVAGGIFWFRARNAGPPADLVALLPTTNATVVSIDVEALRRSGILSLLAGAKAVEDADYQQFVNETKFDYRQDLDAIAASFEDGKVYFALRGRFHWDSLKEYAMRQGGSCHNDFCVVAGSQPNRRISFYPLQRDVLAMAVGPDDFAAYQVASHSVKLVLARPKEPIWALVPGPAVQGAALQKMDSLPAAAKAYLPALQGADQIVFSIGADASNQLQLSVEVTCKDANAASALQTQLENITNALRQGFAKARQKADPADLGGVLVAGTFHRSERDVYGAWPLPRALIASIFGAGY